MSYWLLLGAYPYFPWQSVLYPTYNKESQSNRYLPFLNIETYRNIDQLLVDKTKTLLYIEVILCNLAPLSLVTEKKGKKRRQIEKIHNTLYQLQPDLVHNPQASVHFKIFSNTESDQPM